MNNKSRYWLLIPLVAILVNFSIHIYLASHTRLISDDYCSAAMAERLGIAHATWYWYLNWSGRYSASTLDSIAGLLGPLTTAVAVPIVVSIWLGILAATIHSLISSNKSGFLGALLLGANVLFLTLLLSPNIRQSLYWGQGMRSVLPPMILMTLYIGWFRWLQTQSQNTKYFKLWLLASFLYAFGMGGFSETFTSLQVVLFSMALFFQLMIQNRTHLKTVATPILISTLAGSVLALLAVVMSPGNSYRLAQLPQSPELGNVPAISIRSFALFWLGLFDSPEKILGIMGGLGIGFFVGSQGKTFRVPKKIWTFLPLLTLGVMFIGFPPAAYGLLDTPPGRTLIIPVYLLAIAITALGYLAGNQLQQHSTGLRLTKPLSLIAVTAFMISNYLIDDNLLSSRKIFIDFADKWDRIHVQIQQDRSAGKEQAIVETMDDVNWAGATTIHDNSGFWLNQCISQYYGINTIAVDEPASYQE